MVDVPARIDESQMEDWASDFDSWAVTDPACFGLFRQTAFAYDKAVEWSERNEEFVKRDGFVLMAGLVVHDKRAPDGNFVKKAVNWALRSIGKRSIVLNQAAIDTAGDIQKRGTRAARWIAADAIRELIGDKD